MNLLYTYIYKNLKLKSRGVEDSSSYTMTAKLGGCFKNEPDCRAEFMSLIKK